MAPTRDRGHRVGQLGAAAGAFAFGLMLVYAPAADADPVTDGWYATCHVLDDNLNGDPAHDEQIITGVKNAVRDHYNVVWMDAVAIAWRQMTMYCPSHQQQWLNAENWQLNASVRQ